MDHYLQAVTLRWYNACAYYAVSLSKGLESLGARVTFAGGHGTPAVIKAREAGLNVHEGPEPVSNSVLNYMALVRSYRNFAIKNGVTLVNVHHGSDHIAWALALRGTGIPLIRTCANQHPPKKHAASRYLFTRKTSGVIASCAPLKGFFTKEFGYESDSVPIINGGVDSAYFSTDCPRGRLRKELGLPKDAFVYGILARYSPDKGHEHFFRAAEIIARKYPDAWFFVGGWNAQINETEIRAMAQKVGIIDRVRFAGKYPDTRDLIGTLDVGVISSVRSETVCRIAMEYMAMGVPVVATDTNVIPEVVRHGVTGLVVKAGDHEGMAAAMEQMYRASETNAEFGRQGRRIVEADYSLESFAQKTLKAYGGFTGNG